MYLDEFMEMILSMDYPHDRMSLVFCEGNSADNSYGILMELKHRFGSRFRRFEVLKQRTRDYYSPFQRHLPFNQRRRYRLIAEARNMIASRIEDEDYVLWIDADIEEVPGTLVKDLMSNSVDIVAPLVLWDRMNPKLYTLGHSVMVNGSLIDIAAYYGGLNNIPQELIPVDGVEGCFLVRAEIHRRVSFPDNIAECVGFCLKAKELGYKVYVDGRLRVWHRVIDGMKI